MAARPIWVQFRHSQAISATGITAVDLLGGHIDALQQSERTVVAVKGWVGIDAGTVASPTPDSFELHWGLVTGVNTLVAADFPLLDLDGSVNPGWMYREQYRGVVTGDGTQGIQVFNSNRPFDVKAKRSLAGVGIQTLFLIVDVPISVSFGTITFTGQTLLATKG